MNDDIKEYTTPSGKKRYKFSVYAGKDQSTGNSIQARKRGFKSYSEALKKYEDIQKRVKAGTYLVMQDHRYRVKDFYKVWSANYKPSVKIASFVQVDRIYQKHILKDLGNVYLDKLTPIICQQTVNKWANEHGKATYKLEVIYLKKMLEYAVILNVIHKNPMKKIIKPKPKEKSPREKKKDYYTKEELSTFLNTCKEHKPLKIYTLFRVLAYTGARVGEVLALKWSDINFDEKTIDINKTVSTGENNTIHIGTPKTKSSYRLLTMDDETMTILKKWQFQQRRNLFKLGFNPLDQDQLVFSNFNNELINDSYVSNTNRYICEKYNLRRIKVHGFRHTHASLLFNAGASMEDVKDRLGHSSITMTMNVYTHVMKEKKKDTVNKLIQYMEG